MEIIQELAEKIVSLSKLFLIPEEKYTSKKINDSCSIKMLKSRLSYKEIPIIKTKFLSSENLEDIAKFLVEGYLASYINHKNVIKVLDYGGNFLSHQYFIVLENYGQETLEHWCKKSPFSIKTYEQYLEWIFQAIKALEAIHEKKFIHGNIQPSNFYIINNTLKLKDFGNYQIDSEINLKYFAPEKLDKKFGEISTATDIYELGMVLYTILNPKFFLTDFTPKEMEHLHTEGNFPKIDNIPYWMNELIESMLEKFSKNRIKLAKLRELVENNLTKTITKKIEESEEIIKKLDSDSTEKIKDSAKELIDRLFKILSIYQESNYNNHLNIFQNIVDSIIKLQEKLLGIDEKEKISYLSNKAQFMIERCPNLKCERLLEPGKTECPNCHTKWIIPCQDITQECKEETPYLRNTCQKCRKQCPISVDIKKKFSLLLTIQQCQKEKKYIDIIVYCEKFNNLTSLEISKILADAREKYSFQQMKKKAEISQEVNLKKNKILQYKLEKEITKKSESIKKQNSERDYYLKEMQTFCENGEIVLAYNYYRNIFPQSLKDLQTEEIYEKICDELTQKDVIKSDQFLESGQYEKALDILNDIEEPYITTRIKFGKARINKVLDILKEKKISGFTFLAKRNSILEYRHDEISKYSTGVESEFVLVLSSLSQVKKSEILFQPFFIAKTTITQKIWEQVMRNNPSKFKGVEEKDNPVEQVSWEDAKAFCKKINQSNSSEYNISLPSEVQWKYAYQAKTGTRYFFGDDKSVLGKYAWYYINSDNTTHPVAQKEPNAYGLYDMAGNVWEWCEDVYSNTSFRIGKGGSWRNDSSYCIATYQGRSLPNSKDDNLGFRVIVNIPLNQ